GLRDVIEKRVNLFGVAEPKVVTAYKDGSYQLLIELAGVKELSDAVKQIGEVPVLDFREVQISGETATIIPTDLTGRYIKNASIGLDNITNRAVVNFELDKGGAEIFERITEKNVGKPICIFVDGNFIFPEDQPASCPNVNEKISGGKAQISGGNITIDSARQLVSRFQAGALSAPIKPINQRTVSSSVAEDSLEKILIAGAAGTFLVLIFMIVYYKLFGFFSAIALMIYTVLTLSVFKLIPDFTMTLAGIAGFILSIGMAVDANILIFERTKEEIKRGLSRRSAIEEGFKRAWSSIRDSNISTIITAIILYYFTSSFVKGFALTLGVGVLMSMFSAIFVTRVMLRIFIKNKHERN
ncbi:MAG TPA: protein translocase subunit SecD, partial [Candidatus Paceibacterota bacterium]